MYVHDDPSGMTDVLCEKRRQLNVIELLQHLKRHILDYLLPFNEFSNFSDDHLLSISINSLTQFMNSFSVESVFSAFSSLGIHLKNYN